MSPSKIIVAVLLALLVLIIVLQNVAAVETRLLFWTIQMPQALLLFATTMIGFVLGVLSSYFTRRGAAKVR